MLGRLLFGVNVLCRLPNGFLDLLLLRDLMHVLLIRVEDWLMDVFLVEHVLMDMLGLLVEVVEVDLQNISKIN
jgi:hypothetical protein